MPGVRTLFYQIHVNAGTPIGAGGTILTVEGKVKMKQRNYGDKVNLANSLPVLDHSNGAFLVILRLHFTAIIGILIAL